MELNINHLSREEYEVTQNCGTEPPFSGKLLSEKRKGTYLCIVCKEELFNSNTKFESGSGWPSFFASIENKIIRKEDRSFGMIRTEILCSNCVGHQGHVFDDGPTATGKRYCVNSASINFINNKNE